MNVNGKLFKTSATILTLGVFILLAAGSGPYYQDTTDYTRVDVKSGTIESDVRIVAVDGRFELKPGERFTPPFYSDLYFCSGLDFKNILESYSSVRGCGAVEVKIYVGDDPEPLYGLLALNRAIRASFGPAARSYLIKIPEDKIYVARQGNTAVAFEYMTYKKTWYNDSGQKNATRNHLGWVLWMSSVPF